MMVDKKHKDLEDKLFIIFLAQITLHFWIFYRINPILIHKICMFINILGPEMHV
jgi:hypothetical protein